MYDPVVLLFVTLWTIVHWALLSMELSRQEYWSGLPFPFPGDLPDPGIEPGSPTLEADALTSEPPGKLKIVCNLLKYPCPVILSVTLKHSSQDYFVLQWEK